jgi:hypothetical protein
MRKVLVITIILTAISLTYCEVVTFSDNWGKNPLFNVTSISNAGVDITFSIHKMIVEEAMVDGVLMKTYGIPGIFLQNDEGAPNVAGTGRYIAIPQYATAIATIIDARTEVYHNIEVAPAPNIPLDNDDSPLRYVKNMNIYSKDEYYPSSPVKLSEPMQIRGVDCVILGITPFQYNPVTKELIVYKDIKVRVDFIGGNGHFGDDALRNPYWESILQGHLLNYNSLHEFDYTDYYERLHRLSSCRDGWEYIIIVPDDSVFIAWADTIKSWRKLQGIATEVFTLSEIGGTSATAIENFLDNAYNTWNPRPVAFLILSDYPNSGEKVYGVTSPLWNNYCVSDNKYADVNEDSLPDMFHGRICAQNEEQLRVMVNKFLSYERNPYEDTAFYNHPIVAGAWMTERWFQLCCEVIAGFFEYGLNKDPIRLYAIFSGSPYIGGPWSTASGTATVVNYFHNLGWISLTNPYNSSWWSNGSATSITNAINNGSFIILHRDHGFEQGWGEPAYSNSHINNLTNDELIFVYSTNGLTGKYDWINECFAEKWHRYHIGDTLSGALAVNAPSGNDFSFNSDVYLWGNIDCLWQQFMPDYPSNETPPSNLCPAIAQCYAKYLLQASSWPGSASTYKVSTYHLYHHHGDVFNPLNTEMPQALTVVHNSTLAPGATSFTVTVNDSSIIALTVNNEIIGVAQGTGNPVPITISPQTAGNNMIVTVTKQNYYRYQATVPIVSSSVSDYVQPVNKLITTLYAPKPNPVNKEIIQISFSIAEPSKVSLKIYDASGKLVRILVHNQQLTTNNYSLIWNGKDDNNRTVAEGIYFCTLETPNQKFTMKLILTR